MSVYVKIGSSASQICKSDLRHLNAKSNWKTYKDNGWTMEYTEVYDHIFFVKGNITIPQASDVSANQLVIVGNPITPLVDTILPMTVMVGNTPTGYGNVVVANNAGIYLNSTGYAAAHSYVFYGYLVN